MFSVEGEDERGMLLTQRMETRARCGVVRVMRPRIVAPTVGRRGVLRVALDVVERETVRACVLFACAGIEMPARDEMTWLSKMCVPVLAIFFVIAPSDWPGRTIVEVEVVEDMIVDTEYKIVMKLKMFHLRTQFILKNMISTSRVLLAQNLKRI